MVSSMSAFVSDGIFCDNCFKACQPFCWCSVRIQRTHFIGELRGRFSAGNPQVGEPVAQLLTRDVRLKYGQLPDGTKLEASVIFAPIRPGIQLLGQAAQPKVVKRLMASVTEGTLRFNPVTKHLARTAGACVFCTMLEIGPCDYLDEIEPLTEPPALRTLAVAVAAAAPADKALQRGLLERFLDKVRPTSKGWDMANDVRAKDSAKGPP